MFRNGARLLSAIAVLLLGCAAVGAHRRAVPPEPAQVRVYEAFHKLNLSDAHFKPEMRIVKCSVEPDGDDGHGKKYFRWHADTTMLSDGSQEMTVREGDYFRIEVRNMGDQTGYLTLLDFAEKRVSRIWPGPEVGVPSFQVDPGGKWIALRIGGTRDYAMYRFTPTQGDDLFKIIVTDRSLDFGPYLDPAGSAGIEGRIVDLTQNRSRPIRCATVDYAIHVEDRHALRVLSIGRNSEAARIGGVGSDALALRYCETDAREIAKLWGEAGAAEFGSVDVTTLTGETANAAEIRSVLARIAAESSVGDTFVLYYAGAYHRLDDHQAYCLNPPGHPVPKPGETLSIDELKSLFANIPASQQLVLLDGALIGDGDLLAGSVPVKAFTDGLVERASLQKQLLDKVFVVAGSLGEPTDLDTMKRSVLSEALQAALAKESKALDDRQVLTQRTLLDYLAAELPSRSNGRLRLLSSPYGRAFALAAFTVQNPQRRTFHLTLTKGLKH